LSLALLGATFSPGLGANMLETMEIGLIAANIVIVGCYVSTMYNSTSAGRQAMMTLITGRYAVQFLGGAIFVGLILSLLLALFFLSTHVVLILAFVAAADLIGHFSIFFLLLRAGLFAPIM